MPDDVFTPLVMLRALTLNCLYTCTYRYLNICICICLDIYICVHKYACMDVL